MRIQVQDSHIGLLLKLMKETGDTKPSDTVNRLIMEAYNARRTPQGGEDVTTKGTARSYS